MIRILESLENKEGKLVVDVKDSEGELKELLDYIKGVSDAGHTFEVVVDPGNEDWEKSFEIDGDGAFKIKEVEFEKDDEDEDEEIDEINVKEESIIQSNDLFTALDDMYKAMENVLDIWDNDDNRDSLDNGDYPFDKDFNELVTDVAIYVRQCKEIYKANHPTV